MSKEYNVSLYIHWPFCTKKCYYCDLNSYVNQDIDKVGKDTGSSKVMFTLKRGPGELYNKYNRRKESVWFTEINSSSSSVDENQQSGVDSDNSDQEIQYQYQITNNFS